MTLFEAPPCGYGYAGERPSAVPRRSVPGLSAGDVASTHFASVERDAKGLSG